MNYALTNKIMEREIAVLLKCDLAVTLITVILNISAMPCVCARL